MLEQELAKIWGEWKIEKTLGEGAFGKVYQISKEEYGHLYEAALKVINIPQNKSELTSVMSDCLDEKSVTVYFDNIVADIVKEIVLMNSLKGNTNIVSYEDHKVVKHEEEIGWTIYIRMELLTPLYDYVKSTPPSVKDVVKLGIDICNALEVCQYDKIIHRDIKPENIFVSKNGNYKLGDFGIARQMEKNNMGLSKKGTFTYMAPEVYKGENYNETVDIYSLGIVLYRFLNGNRAPFLPAYPAMITPVEREQANVKRLCGAKIERPCHGSEELANIVLKACAYNPEERYQNASDMKADLQRVLDKIEYMNTCKTTTVEEGETTTVLEESTEDDEATSVLVEAEQEAVVLEEPEQEAVVEEEAEQEAVVEEEAEQEAVVEEEAEQEAVVEEEPEQEVKSGTQKNNKLKIIIAATLVIILGVVATIAMRGNGKIKVPDLTNMTLQEVEEAGYEFIVVEGGMEYSDVVEKDCIISQSIESGTEIEEGMEVEVIISKGKAIVVPDFTGMTLEEAELKAEEIRVTLKIEEEFSEDAAEGEIISQNLKEGTEVEEGTEIIIVVNKGVEEEEENTSTYVPEKTYKPKEPSYSKEEEFYEEEVVEGEYQEEMNPESGEDIGEEPVPDVTPEVTPEIPPESEEVPESVPSDTESIPEETSVDDVSLEE